MHESYFVSIPECDEFTGFGIKEFDNMKDAEFAYRAWCSKAREDWRELLADNEQAAKATVNAVFLQRAEFEDEESWDNGGEPLAVELVDEFRFGLKEFEEWNSFEPHP